MTVYHKEFNPPLEDPSRIGIAFRCFFGNRKLKPGARNIKLGGQGSASVTVARAEDGQIRGNVTITPAAGNRVNANVGSSYETIRSSYSHRLDEGSSEISLEVRDTSTQKVLVYGVLWFKPNKVKKK